MAARADRRPVVLGLERDRGRDSEERRRVARALPAMAVGERRSVEPVPRDDAGSIDPVPRAARTERPSPSVRRATCGSSRRRRRRRVRRGRARSGPGAWAPSTIESAPSARAAEQTAARSLTRPVVPFDVRAEDDPRLRPGLELGERGSPERHAGPPATKRQRISMPPYSASPSSTSSPGSSASERMTAFSAELVFVRERPRSSGGAPT